MGGKAVTPLTVMVWLVRHTRSRIGRLVAPASVTVAAAQLPVRTVVTADAVTVVTDGQPVQRRGTPGFLWWGGGAGG
jgi:hypothetical protein